MTISNSNWQKLKTEIARLKGLQVCSEGNENVELAFQQVAMLIQKIEAEEKASRPSVIRS